MVSLWGTIARNSSQQKMRLFTKFILCWMVIWLPVAGVMAAVMPFAGDAKDSVLLFSSVNLRQVADNEKFATPCHGASKKSMIGQSCSHCVLCHLAGALALGAMPVMPQVAPTHIFSALLIRPNPSFIPDLIIPPPRSSLA